MLTLGDVVAADLPAFPALLAQLGYPAEPEALPGRIERIRAGGGRVVVAREGDEVLGLVALAFIPLVHHEQPLARISALVVAEAARGRGVGRRLVAEAERIARAAGCTRIEVTSADHRAAAHAFYLALGYAEKRRRFLKSLA
jgi:GNAT superfamily N-acetyltransferase